jgi:hypothetical protein
VITPTGITVYELEFENFCMSCRDTSGLSRAVKETREDTLGKEPDTARHSRKGVRGDEHGRAARHAAP